MRILARVISLTIKTMVLCLLLLSITWKQPLSRHIVAQTKDRSRLRLHAISLPVSRNWKETRQKKNADEEDTGKSEDHG